jgi:hypothetical protein
MKTKALSAMPLGLAMATCALGFGLVHGTAAQQMARDDQIAETPPATALTPVQASLAALASDDAAIHLDTWLRRSRYSVTVFAKPTTESEITILNIGPTGNVLVLYPNTKLAGGPTSAQHVVQVPEPDALYTVQETADTPAGTRELILVIRTPAPLKINGAPITADSNASSGARIFPVLKLSGAAFATALFDAKRSTPSMTIAALDTSRATAPVTVTETGAKYWHDMGVKRLLGAQGAYKGPPPPSRFTDALEHFERAFTGGHAASATRLGFMHENGVGVPVALPEAKTWYERAAAKGDTEGMVRLARLLLARDGKVDQSRAFDLLQQAAARSEPLAYRDLVAVYDRGKAVPRDGAKAADAFVKALAVQDWNILEDFTDYGLPVRKAIQAHMKAAGHYSGPIDGLDGEVFRLALGARVSAIRKGPR